MGTTNPTKLNRKIWKIWKIFCDIFGVLWASQTPTTIQTATPTTIPTAIPTTTPTATSSEYEICYGG